MTNNPRTTWIIRDTYKAGRRTIAAITTLACMLCAVQVALWSTVALYLGTQYATVALLLAFIGPLSMALLAGLWWQTTYPEPEAKPDENRP